MLKSAGEQLLEEETEDACHMITDRFARCPFGGEHVVPDVRDPEDPDYEFVYCKKHFKMLKKPDTLVAQIARVERCLGRARAEEEPVVPFNPFANGGAAGELVGPVAPAAFAQVAASNNPFLAAAQASATKAIVSADELAREIAAMGLSP